MKTYTVRIPEVYYSYIVVEAEDEKDAIKEALNGVGDYANNTEYAYTLDDETKFDVLEH